MTLLIVALKTLSQVKVPFVNPTQIPLPKTVT